MELIPIDLSKAYEASGGHGESDHPDIQLDRWYLAEIQNGKKPMYLTGTFSRQWYGLNFDCDWGGSGLQFDKPGTNKSSWLRLWLLEPTK